MWCHNIRCSAFYVRRLQMYFISSIYGRIKKLWFFMNHIVRSFPALRGAAKKLSPLIARPIRPYPPPPSRLISLKITENGIWHLFGDWEQNKKSSFPLMAFTPLSLSGDTFLRLPLCSLTFYQDFITPYIGGTDVGSYHVSCTGCLS